MDYKVHLKQYEGPLDLLLHLVERAEVDISDIFVSEITNQFLEYMDQLMKDVVSGAVEVPSYFDFASYDEFAAWRDQ